MRGSSREKLKRRAIPDTTRSSMRQELYKSLRTFEINCSQVGDTRPVSSCRFSPDSSLIATSSWSGLCKLWSVPQLEQLLRTFRGHKEQAGCVKFHPHSTDLDTLAQSSISPLQLLMDLFILWSLENEQPLSSLPGH